MTGDRVDPHTGARRLRRGLAVLVGVLVLATAWSLQRDLRGHVEMLSAWPRHAATVQSTADEAWLELEVPAAVLQQMPQLRRPEHASPHQDDHVRVLVQRPLYLGGGNGDAVDLAHDPDDPQRVQLLDPMALWTPVAARGLLLGLLLLAWKGLRQLAWGRDQTWADGRWVDTALLPMRAGSRAAPKSTFREPEEHLRGTRFWAGFFGLATVGVVILGASEWQRAPLEVAAVVLCVGVLGLLMLHTRVTTRTRRLGFDDAGVADTSFFRTRRVPWRAIASFDRVNIHQAAQARYDRDYRVPGNRTRGRTRLRSVYCWIAKEAGGTELLRIPAELEGKPAFVKLRRRIDAALRPRPAAQTGGPHDGEEDETDLSESELREMERMAAPERPWQAARRRSGAVVLALMLAPFVLATALAMGRTVWFIGWGDRAEGTVVEKPEGTLPSLVVAYTTAQGRTLRIESDGTEAYRDIAVGARITVFHDARQPDDARLDLFLELWLWPMILAGLTGVVAAPAVFIMRSVHRRTRGPGAPSGGGPSASPPSMRPRDGP